MNATIPLTKSDSAAQPTAETEISLAEFNRLHGDQLRRAAEARASHIARQRTDRIYEAFTLLLILFTALGSVADLLHMAVR